MRTLSEIEHPTKDQHGMLVAHMLNVVPKMIPIVNLLLIRTGLVETEDRR